MHTIPMMMQALVAKSQARLAPGRHDALEVPDVPPAFNRLAYADFALLSEADEDLAWEDYCPAYALGLLTYAAHRDARGLQAAPALESQWNALRGASHLDWTRARAIIARSWNALTQLDGAARQARVA